MIQDNYTGIGLKDWNIIIQKQDQPREIKVTIHSKDIPEMKEVDNVIQYLGEEGFLDYADEGSLQRYLDNIKHKDAIGTKIMFKVENEERNINNHLRQMSNTNS